MPRSSVYVRLQWSTDGATEEAGATTSQQRDTAQSPTPHSTQKTLQPQHSSQEALEIKEGSSGDGSVHHGSTQPPERRQEHKSSHKSSVCPAKSPSSPHPPASPPPVCSTTVTLLPGSTLITTAASTTTVPTMTTATAATKHGRHAEASLGTQARVKVKVRDAPRDKLRRNLTERIPRTTQGGDDGTGIRRTSRAPHLDTSHSLDSPLWHSREQARTDAEGEPQDGAQDGASKPEGARIYYKSKARLRPKNPNAKGRRITRSLSASCVSVSTNTDPKDFLELAKLSGTLSSRKEKEAHISRKKDSSGSDTKTKSVKEETDSSGSQVADSKGHSDVKTRPEVTQKPQVKEVREELKEEDEEDQKCCKAKGTTEESEETPEVILEEDVTEKLSDTRCAGDGCDDAGKGYIELPTYSPSQPSANLQEKLPDHLPPYPGDPSCPSLPVLPCGPPYPSFHAHTGPLPLPTPSYFTRVPVEGTPTPAEEQKFIVITPHLTPPPSDSLEKAAPSSECPPPSSPPLRVCPVPLSSSPSLDHSQTFSSFKPSPSRTFHLSSQDDADLSASPYPATPSSSFHCTSVESLPPKAIHQDVIPRSPSSQIIERCHWGDKNTSPYPTNRPPTPAIPRRHLERDMSLDSCPDVVLQTLEAEGAASQNKTLKKTVTFLLPPDHWDSLISLRESSIGGYPQSGYAELDASLLPPNGDDPYRNTPSPGMQALPQDRYADDAQLMVRWRDPDLHEVIDFLSNPNNVVKANAAAYLQHLCYMDDPTKQKTRILGGIPPLVALLTHDLPELHRNACGALRNLSYGRQNDENKRAIKDAQGIPALVRLLRKTPDNEIKELVTGILWNLSSCEDLKHSILDDALTVIVSHVIIPCSGWDGGEVERDPNVDVWWSTVFKNASGVLRNISSAGEYARTKLRQCHGLVDSLLTVIKSAIQGSSHDNKSVENCVCILRNLSYRCQEVEDPNYDKNQPPTQSRATATAKGDNLGCFGGSRKKKEAMGGAVKESSGGTRSTGPRTEPLRGMELLWQPEIVVGPYLALLSDCSNPETLEAAAGALQNLAACYWQPSIDVRAAVRKEKGLPILVELLRMEVDRVVCAVATALRNLAIDQRNKELIGKYAMRDLVQKLPSGNTHDSGTSDETIAAVLATLNEVIKKSAEFSRSLLDVGGVERLVNMTRHRGRYSVRVVKFASQVLFSMWGHQELREVYKKAGWKEQDFVSKSVAARNAASGGANSPTANNTLNRPMASQGGTRYEDRTIQRGQGKTHQMYSQGQQVPMADMGYGSGGGIGAPAGGVRLYPSVQDIGVPQH